MSKPVDEKVTAWVEGKRVTHLKALVRHAAFLILPEGNGSHEYTRMYVSDGVVRCGDRDNGRVGPAAVTKVEFDRALGLTVTTKLGVIWSPPSDCQVTWEV